MVAVWSSYGRRVYAADTAGAPKQRSVVAYVVVASLQGRPPHGDLVDSLGRQRRSVVAVLCDGGFINDMYAVSQYLPSHPIFVLIFNFWTPVEFNHCKFTFV